MKKPLVVLLSTGLALGLSAAPAHAATSQVKVVQYNTSHLPAEYDHGIATGDAWDADVVLLQEVCQGWADATKQANASRWTVAFHPRRQHDACGGGFIGEMAVYRGGPEGGENRAEGWYDFDVAGDTQEFGMACVRFSGPGGTRSRACSVHLTAYDGDTVRGRQTRWVKSQTSVWINNGVRVVMGGDFNAGPKKASMDAIYKNPAGTSDGRFNEVTQIMRSDPAREGNPTAGTRKIDYVFYAGKYTGLGASGSLSMHKSRPGDHNLLKASAAVSF